MTRVKARIIIITLLIAASLSSTLPAFATSNSGSDIDSLINDREEIQDELKAQKLEIEENSKISKEIQEEIKLLDEKVDEIYKELEEVEVDLVELEVDIEDNLTQLDDSKDILDDKQEYFDARLRVMYMNGSVGYLDLLLSSKNISDFLSRRDMIKSIADQDIKLLDTIKAQKELIEDKNTELIDQRETLSTLKSNIENKSVELEEAIVSKLDLISELELDEEELREEYNVLNGLNGLSEDIDSEIIRLEGGRSQMSTPISTQSDVLDKLNNLRDGYESVSINFTTPYVYGGNTSRGMDCTAFTLDVYRQLGVGLPRTSHAQARVGRQVSKVELKPGDLVIFSGTYTSGPSHTGIYLGAGEFIHQSSSGNGATVSKLTGYYSRHFSYGRRLW